jgi:hypothetical protein
MKKQLRRAMQLHREPMGSVGFFFTLFSKLMGVSILFSVAKLMIIATPVLSICKSSIILPVLMLCQDEFTIVLCYYRTFVSVNNNCLLPLKNIFCGCEFQFLFAHRTFVGGFSQFGSPNQVNNNNIF